MKIKQAILNMKLLKKGYIHAVLLAFLSFPYACETVPTLQNQAAPECAKGIVKQVAPIQPKTELTDELLYKILLAEFAGQRGMLAIAVNRYLDLAHMTHDLKLIKRATRIALYARDQQAAVQAAELWFELDPSNSELRQTLALLSIEEDDLDQALLHLNFIMKNSDGSIDQKLWAIASFLRKKGDPAMVMAVMELLMQDYTDNTNALYTFAQIASQLGQLDKSQTILEQALQIAPESERLALAYIAILLQNRGSTSDTIIWIEDWLKTQDGNNTSLRYAYALLLAEKQPDKALQQLKILIEQLPNDARILHMLALLYLQTNQSDLAAIYFLRLADIEKQANEAYYYLGYIAEKKNNLEQASDWYQKIKKGKHYFNAHIRLGFILFKQQGIETGLQYIRTIRLHQYQDKLMRIQAEAEMLTEAEHYQEAIEILNAAIKKRSHPDLLYMRAMLADKMDRFDILEQDLRTILQDRPDDAQALNALGYTLADKTDRYNEAHALIKKALELSPDNFYILDSMGWVLYKLGNFDEAVKYLGKALKLHADPEVAAHLGEVLWVIGKKQEARNIWDAALKNTPKNDRLLDTIRRFDP